MIIFLLLFFAIVLQIAILPQFKILGVVPNLILIVLLLIFFRIRLEKNYKFFIYTTVTGLILDFFSNAPFGVITLSLILCFFLIGLLRHIILASHTDLLIISVLLFTATLIYNILLFFLTHFFLAHFGSPHFFDYVIDSRFFFLRTMSIEIVYNILLGLFIFYVISGFRKISY